MATGYSSTSISKTSGFTANIRFKYTTTYDIATNTSTVALLPQVKTTANFGSDVRFFGPSTSTAGVYGNGTKRYSVGNNYGGNDTLRTSATTQNSWASLSPHSGSISTFSITHNEEGVASFTCGMIGTLVEMYSNSTATFNSKNGITVSITETAPYSITYDANNGTGAPPPQNIYATCTYTISTIQPTRNGFSFLGWDTSSSATTATYMPGDEVTPNGDLSLYAVWSETVKSVILTGNENIQSVTGGGTYDTGDTVICSANLKTEPNYNYTFNGWFSNGILQSTDNPYGFTMGENSVTLQAIATKQLIPLPEISSVIVPTGEIYLIADNVARDLIAQKDANIQYFTSQVLSTASNAEILRIVDSSITPNTICTNIVIDNPNYVSGRIYWTSYYGYIAFTGTCTTTTTADITLARKSN